MSEIKRYTQKEMVDIYVKHFLETGKFDLKVCLEKDVTPIIAERDQLKVENEKIRKIFFRIWVDELPGEGNKDDFDRWLEQQLKEEK